MIQLREIQLFMVFSITGFIVACFMDFPLIFGFWFHHVFEIMQFFFLGSSAKVLEAFTSKKYRPYLYGLLVTGFSYILSVLIITEFTCRMEVVISGFMLYCIFFSAYNIGYFTNKHQEHHFFIDS